MIIIASANGSVGMEAATAILGNGGSALDAVEAAANIVESNVDDHSVGVGGYPNILGDVELDASIMEGATRRAGAVAALRGYPHPISVARAILEHLPHHLLLVGEGAARFATEHGFAMQDLLTPEAKSAWHSKIGNAGASAEIPLSAQAHKAHDPERTVGTVNFIAQDSRGQIASAVSTSGWAFKYPGRVGDSPLIGAGNYCDDRFGACTCTGLGEWAIRGATARTVVIGLQYGLSLQEACERAMRDLKEIPLPPDIENIMNLIALDRNGQHIGCSTAAGRTYLWQTPEMNHFEAAERLVV